MTDQGYTEDIASDTGPFTIIPEWIIDAQISHGAVRLYALLGRYADYNTGRAFPSRKLLASRLRVSTHTVDRMIVELVNVSAVEVLKRAETVRELLGLTEAYYKYLDEQIERLCEVTMTSQRINEVLEVVAPLKNVTSDTPAHVIERRQEKRAMVTINLDQSPTIENRLRSTAWGMYNSITEIEQWQRDTLPTKSQSEQMLGNHVGIVPMTTVSDRVYRVMERWLSPA